MYVSADVTRISTRDVGTKAGIGGIINPGREDDIDGLERAQDRS